MTIRMLCFVLIINNVLLNLFWFAILTTVLFCDDCMLLLDIKKDIIYYSLVEMPDVKNVSTRKKAASTTYMQPPFAIVRAERYGQL